MANEDTTDESKYTKRRETKHDTLRCALLPALLPKTFVGSNELKEVVGELTTACTSSSHHYAHRSVIELQLIAFV